MIGQDLKYYEDGIINAALILPEQRPQIFNNLHSDHFEPGGMNRQVYGVMEKLYEEFRPEPFSNQAVIADVCNLLKQNNFDWKFWIEQLMMEAPIPTDVEFYIRRIKQYYNKRRLVEISNAANKRIEKGENTETIAAFVRSEYEKLESEKVNCGPVSFFDVAADCIEKLESSNFDDLTGIKTGYSLLDKYILGMRPGDLIVLAGRPSHGKTTLATNIAINAAKSGYCGLIFSLEMGQYRLGLRMISSETETNLYQLSRGEVSDYRQITKISSGLKNIYIDFDVNLTCYDVVSRIREFSQTTHPHFIMLDYLQKLRFPSRERHDLSVAEATLAFKNAAKEFGLPFVLLSQLSRANEKDGKAVRRPRLSDLRDSGSIEQDADIVVFIHRQELYEPEKIKYQNIAELFLAKNRDGDTGKIELTFRKQINRFENMAKDDQYG